MYFFQNDDTCMLKRDMIERKLPCNICLAFFSSWVEIQCKLLAVMEYVLLFLEIQTALSEKLISR